jgi:hypothetical protein
MTEQELRALVRDAIRLRTGGDGSLALSAPASGDAGRFEMPTVRQHASHSMFVLPAGADADGPCLIEPAVACNHCGYCKSYGH